MDGNSAVFYQQADRETSAQRLHAALRPDYSYLEQKNECKESE